MATMNKVGTHPCAAPTKPDPCGTTTAKTAVPVCPDCGALECLCRPRFFAGQLLSEQDLNRLDQYIKKKNRLHMRNLHGWGVVNGLLVVCDPCGEVRVTEGYALSPCGDDIVVCQETAVNICELIRQCKQWERKNVECQPFQRPPNSNCNELEEEWVLTIQYEEWPTRGITALRGGSCKPTHCGAGSCGCHTGNCSCNGCKSGGTCSCSASAQTQTKNRAAPVECEPTIICEGFSFGVYRKPEPEDPDRDDNNLLDPESAFAQQFLCCAQPLLDTVPTMPDLDDNDAALEQYRRELANWCCRFRDNLLNYFLTHRNVRCEIIDYLNAVVCPNANNPDNFAQRFLVALLDLLSAWLEGIKNCFCLALLPPVPLAAHDQRVPLATVRVRARDCKILSICNWTTERKMVASWPAVGHWLGIFSIPEFIRELLDQICCNSLLDSFDRSIDATGDNFRFTEAFGRTSAVFNRGYRVMNTPRIAGDLFARIAERGDQTLNLGAVLNSVTRRFKLPDGSEPLSDVEKDNLPLTLVAEVMAKPALRNFLIGAGKDSDLDLGGLTEWFTGGADVTTLDREVKRLQTQLRKQNEIIAALSKRLDEQQ